MPPAHIEQQLRRTLDGALLQLRIDAALESLRSIRDQAVATAASATIVGCEERAFEKYIDWCSSLMPESSPPMTPRHAEERALVGDHQHVRASARSRGRRAA